MSAHRGDDVTRLDELLMSIAATPVPDPTVGWEELAQRLPDRRAPLRTTVLGWLRRPLVVAFATGALGTGGAYAAGLEPHRSVTQLWRATVRATTDDRQSHLQTSKPQSEQVPAEDVEDIDGFAGSDASKGQEEETLRTSSAGQIGIRRSSGTIEGHSPNSSGTETDDNSDNSGSSDDSGPGSTDDGDADNSGPGSGDGDTSGSDSGDGSDDDDDDLGEDNSGSGSDGSDESDDSGSGSDDDQDLDDSDDSDESDSDSGSDGDGGSDSGGSDDDSSDSSDSDSDSGGSDDDSSDSSDSDSDSDTRVP